jgi:hypothetical protein
VHEVLVAVNEPEAQQRKRNPQSQEYEKGDPRKPKGADPQEERQHSKQQDSCTDRRARLTDIDQQGNIVVINIGNEPQQTYGTACRQPDGTWQIQPT